MTTQSTLSEGHPRRWIILTVLCASLLLIALDTLVLNLAIPNIQADLASSSTELQWIIDGYALAFGALLLPAGSLADRFGRKRLLLVGMLVFLVFSVASAYSSDPSTLIAMRGGMGVGAAMIMPSTLAIIKEVFAPAEQAKAIGMWAGTAALGISLGPIVGGILLEHFWWGSVFLINVPIVAVVVVAGVIFIPESRSATPISLDVVGAVLAAAGFGAVVYGLVEASRHGWGHPLTLGSVGAGLAVLAMFVWWERRAPAPMLPPGLLRDREFGGCAAIVICIAFALYGALFVLTQYLQFVRGHEPMAAGLRLLPIGALVVGAPLGAKLVNRLGLRYAVAIGLAVLTTALVATSGATTGSELRTLVGIALLGLGMGLAMPTCANAMLAVAPPDRSGAGSAVTDTALQIGGSLGIAVVGSVLTTSYRDLLTDKVPSAAGDSIGAAHAIAAQLGSDAGLIQATNQAFIQALPSATLTGAAVAALGATVALAVLPTRANTTWGSATDRTLSVGPSRRVGPSAV
ncbi:MFS transporter [Rhodococcus sp. NPDC058521]|uniref:MFS transporter n=1 Tax=Rhodococcus sp. NPDC058521 TaxID=3346536 RepID=UPI0036612D61